MRPYGVVLDGRLEIGIEPTEEWEQFQPHSGLPDPYLITPAFTNAHSHLEYRGLIHALPPGLDYWPWIRRLTELKRDQTLDSVRLDADLAARENRATGVAFIEEHSDRPVAREALASVGLSGRIYQELITFAEHEDPTDKWRQVDSKRVDQGALWAPHAPYTVDLVSLARFADPEMGDFSIHVAETEAENEWVRTGTGPIAEFRARAGFRDPKGYRSVVALLDALGLVRPGAQFVHACAVDSEDLDLMAERGVRVAHCPRSNRNLRCPPAPVREMLDRGIEVGLGMDSAASSGPIDMGAEMRAALETSWHRGKPLGGPEVWRMAVGDPSHAKAFLTLEIAGAWTVDEVIEELRPSRIRWLSETPGENTNP